MIRISQDDLRSKVVFELTRRKRFHCSLGADRHKHRGLDRPVRGVEQARPGARLGADSLYLKAKR